LGYILKRLDVEGQKVDFSQLCMQIAPKEISEWMRYRNVSHSVLLQKKYYLAAFFL